MRARLIAAVSACLMTVAAGTVSASATPHDDSGQTVGGPLLASQGVIVRPLVGAPALPPASALPASSWMVTDLTTGQVLAAKDPHGRFLPASTLKTLTALTLLPKLDPHSTFRATVKDASVDGTRAGLVPNMQYSISTLFTCMLEMSANDAADALSEANGGIKRTVGEMNAKARTLQANDTHADTPSGLDGPGETTSAYDLALIARADFQLPAFRKYITIASSKIPAPHHKHFEIQSHNDLLTTYRGDIGGKNGYTVAAQATYVGAATRHGQTILVTLMHGYPLWAPMASKLLTWGFKAEGKVTPVGNLVAPLPPPGSTVSTQPISHKVLGASLPHVQGRQLPLRTFGIVLAALVVLAGSSVFMRRRRQIRTARHYRSRLRLPPM
jgi:serine-type D-Ala-D-Ala carboxypeptidase (penicillin-binding protein 5/6)